jgi:hypothetical protein
VSTLSQTCQPVKAVRPGRACSIAWHTAVSGGSAAGRAASPGHFESA